ncbi:hypothetical protein LIER_27381 [Lithospermum erythrorhizon]|uniref:VQ domain-containing protein n=1 Tax=Lithospermum erythrorhizon TaxID=34254 RepID=A0AAV3RBV1_LITER
MTFKSVPKIMSKSKGKNSKRENPSIKVVYICTPMKVKTSASRFRALVQELTGRDSDVATLMMEGDKSTKSMEFEVVPEESDKGSNSLLPSILKHEEKSPSDELAITASSSEDLSKHLVDVFSNTQHHHHQIMEAEFIFPFEFIYDSFGIDILGSYGII